MADPAELSPRLLFERALLEHDVRIRRFLRKLAAGRTDIEDLVQEVYARALRSWNSYDPEAPLASWLMKIAFHSFIDERKRVQRQPSVDRAASSDVAVEAPEHPLEAREEVKKLLCDLSQVEKEVVLRFHARGESIREIATAMDMPMGTIKSLLHRTRRKLAARHAQA